MRHRCAHFFVALLLLSCTSERERLSPEQKALFAQYVTSSAPSPRYRLDAVLDARLRLFGYDIDEATWLPGESLLVTWYWEVLAPPRSGSSLTTELEAPEGGSSTVLSGTSVVREVHPPELWRAGQFVRDPQELALPDDWSASTGRLRVRLSVDDAEGARGPAISLNTPAMRRVRPSSAPTLVAVRTKTSPRLDGSPSDPVWEFAKPSRSMVDPHNGAASDVLANAKVLWDSRYLYVAVDVEDALLRSRDLVRDFVALELDPSGRGRRTFEIRISPSGDVTGIRHEAEGDSRLRSEIVWPSRARTAVRFDGTLDDSKQDRGYTVEAAIPWQAFSPGAGTFPPPRIGDRWRFNVVVTDFGKDGRRVGAWSPTDTDDFHVPSRFGILRFEGAPEGMQGSSAPAELPEGRMRAPMRRSVNPAIRDSLLERNAAEKNRLDAVRAKSREPQRLESSKDGH